MSKVKIKNVWEGMLELKGNYGHDVKPIALKQNQSYTFSSIDAYQAYEKSCICFIKSGKLVIDTGAKEEVKEPVKDVAPKVEEVVEAPKVEEVVEAPKADSDEADLDAFLSEEKKVTKKKVSKKANGKRRKSK